MSKTVVDFSKEELKQFLDDPNSCVSVKNSVYSLALYPYHLNDCNASIKAILNLRIGKYEKKLDGILLGYRNVKLLTSAGRIIADSCHIHIDIQADFYMFKPEVDCNLVGVVNKQSKDHVGCLVHRLFNISVPKPDNEEDWVGYLTEIGQEVVLNVTFIDLESRLPYIRAKIDLDHFQPVTYEDDNGKVNGDVDLETTPKTTKKKHKKSKDLNDGSNDIKAGKTEKKKRKHDEHEIEPKPKKEKSFDVDNLTPINSDDIKDIIDEITTNDYDHKKGKKRFAESSVSWDDINAHLHDSELDKILPEKSKNKDESFHKKRKKKKDKNEMVSESIEINDETFKKHKKKRDKNGTLSESMEIDDESRHKKKKSKEKVTQVNETGSSSKKKFVEDVILDNSLRKTKRKRNESFDEVADTSLVHKSKKKRHSKDILS